MKKIILCSILLLCFGTIFSQVPEKFNYQAVLRDASGNLRSQVDVVIQILILQGSVTNNPIYIENHNVRTSAFGLVNLSLGSGSVDLGTFNNINWAMGPYFIKVKVDGIDYGSSEILSVPIALYANKAGNGFSGNYNDLTNTPSLFDGTWGSLTGKPAFAAVAISGTFADLETKPTTLEGYGIVNAMSSSHPSNGITATNLINWNTAFGWGNHAGLYKLNSYVPTWLEITGKPTLAPVALSGSYNDLNNKPTGSNLGDMLYWNGLQWIVVPAGLNGQVLSLSNGVPTWGGIQQIPIIRTVSITNVTTTSATVNGNLTFDGGATAMGVCWSTSPNPTLDNGTAAVPPLVGDFAILIGQDPGSRINPNTSYYVRTYATNEAGTYYGNELSFTASTDFVSDIDENKYFTISIGTQEWMSENLKTTKYNDGTDIPLVTDSIEWAALRTPGYCWYNNDPESYSKTYGALYNWYTVDGTSNGGKNVCPTGWHVPNSQEWLVLRNNFGGWEIAGGSHKSTGIIEGGSGLWYWPNKSATNISGLTVVPAGWRDVKGTFEYRGILGIFWTSDDEDYQNLGLYTEFSNFSSSFGWTGVRKMRGHSVRCIKD